MIDYYENGWIVLDRLIDWFIKEKIGMNCTGFDFSRKKLKWISITRPLDLTTRIRKTECIVRMHCLEIFRLCWQNWIAENKNLPKRSRPVLFIFYSFWSDLCILSDSISHESTQLSYYIFYLHRINSSLSKRTFYPCLISEICRVDSLVDRNWKKLI